MNQQKLQASSRVQYLIDHRHDDHDRKQIPTRTPYYEKAYEEYADSHVKLRIAHGFAAFLAGKKILIQPYDVLAGFSYRYTYRPTFPLNMPDDYDPLFRPPTGIDTFEEAEVGAKLNGFSPDSKEAQEMETFAHCVSHWLYKHWETGHILPGYERLINTGFDGLIEKTEAALKEATGTATIDLEAMLITEKAAIQYINRYAEYAAQLIATTNKVEEKEHLAKLEDALRHIAGGKPRTFLEAVQLIWLTHEMLYAESFPASFSFGRLDMYLHPFYEADLKAGRISHEEAVDIIDALWVKFGVTLHGYQNITIGGLDVDGNYVSNPLTIMMLQACRKTLFDQPLLCLRYHKSMPEEVWQESLELLKTGIGLPAFFIDDFCIPAKMRMGQSKEDATNYGLIGCVEMGCPGKEYSKTECLRVNVAKILELMFFAGKSTCTAVGTVIGSASMPSLKLGDKIIKDYIFPLFQKNDISEVNSFAELLDWYKYELTHHLQFSMTSINRLDTALPECYPTPFLSTLMEGCIETGKDITAGGAIYNNTGINLCGLANVADSLAAIRQLVFEEKRYTLETFKNAMAADYVGYDELVYDIERCPKYGNDKDSVDLLMADIVDAATKQIQSMDNPRGGKWQMGLYSVEDHAKMGIYTGALPDGKRKGEAMASAFSPVQGKDVVGPTASLNSMLKTDLTGATNGMVMDMKFTPSFFDKASHEKALRMLIDAYAAQGGGEIQFNVVGRDTLIDAQNHPEKHRELVVRVSGFSAVFTSLIKETQDEIIKRTEYKDI
ncbi:pyruvate formate lyase family protein [Chakrabartyella piscis]|uniref:pyruvate formate lyase family protein n=1 Tax=Chakrabartyella piscis TaxID=2918914 RepID=UPI002958A364|nr:pyruvate formate lyase family protein [Chakrabartyella piscis]